MCGIWSVCFREGICLWIMLVGMFGVRTRIRVVRTIAISGRRVTYYTCLI